MKLGCIEAQRRTTEQRGIALVLVLWVLALISLLVLTFVAQTRTDNRVVRNQEEAAQAKSIADSGVTLALLGLFDPSPATQWRADGVPHALSYRGGSIYVSVQDERGKVDLNAAPDVLLMSLFQTLGMNGAEQIVAAINGRRAQAEQEASSLIGRLSAPSEPANSVGAFLSIDDLRLVPGVTAAVYDRISPFVTVYSGSAQIDPFTAPPEVVRSLPGADAHEIEIFLSERAGMNPFSVAPLPLTAVTRFIFHGPLQTFSIRSEGVSSGGTHFIRQATATLTGDPSAPYRFLSWRELHPSLSPNDVVR